MGILSAYTIPAIMLNGWAVLPLSDVIALVVEDVDLEAVRCWCAGRQ